jgi:hypothetical protein
MVGETEVVQKDGTNKNWIGMKIEVSIEGECMVVDNEGIVRRRRLGSGEARSQKTNACDGGRLVMMEVPGGIFIGCVEVHAEACIENGFCEATHGTVEVLVQEEKDALVVQFEELSWHG